MRFASLRSFLRRGAFFTALISLALGMHSPAKAAISFLDLNGTASGFGGPSGTADLTTTATWTADATGFAAPAAFNAANVVQIGVAPTDFSNGTIALSLSINGSWSGSNATSGINIVSNNVIVNASVPTGVNARYNHAFQWQVAGGSTLNIQVGGANFNFNNEPATFAGAGTINFFGVLGNNETTGLITENMPNGTLILSQTATSTFGNGSGSGFTLTAGTLQFATPEAIANTFKAFLTSANKISINGGTIDNISGGAGTIGINNGTYSIGGDFTFTGTNSLSLGNAAVALAGAGTARQITVGGSTLTIGGIISSGTLGITKAGPGSLALGGINTYSGATTINAGVLAVNGSLAAASAVTIGGGTLSGSGNGNTTGIVSGAVSLNTGHIDPGASGPGSIGTLYLKNASSLTMNGGDLGFDLSTTDGTSDLISAAGTVVLSASGTITPAAGQNATTYTVLTSSGTPGSITGGLPTLLSASATFRATYAYNANSWNPTTNASANSILIDTVAQVGAVTATWNNAGLSGDGQTWDTVGNSNWSTTGVNVGDVNKFYQGDNVVFNDNNNAAPGGTNPNAYNVTIVATVTPGSVAVSTNNTYTFSGAGGIAGSGALSISSPGGTGTLVVANNNSLTGATTLNSGATLQLGNGGATGSLGTSAITDNGELTINRTGTIGNAISGSGTVQNVGTGTATLQGVLSGGVSVTQNSSGTLKLSGANTYTGATSILAGTLQVSSSASLGTVPGGAVNINGGTLDLSPAASGLNFGTKQFNIQGSGVGGLGAIANNGNTQLGNPAAIQVVKLTSNATIGGTVRFDIGRNNTTTDLIDFNGHTLTKAGTNQNSIVATILQNAPDPSVAPAIISTSGFLSLETTTATIGAGSIQINSGVNVSLFENTTTSGGIGWTFVMMGNNNVGNAGQTAQLPSAIVPAPMLLKGNVTFEPYAGTVPTATNAFPITWQGPITDDGNARIVTFNGTDSATNPSIVLAPSTGANNWGGATNIQKGTVQLGNNNALPTGANVVFGNATGSTSGVLDLGGNNATVGGLSVAGGTTNLITNNSALTNSVLTFAGGTSTFGGAINNGSTKNVGLTVSSGSLTLTAANNYTGNTTVSGGSLTIGAGGSLTGQNTNLSVGSGGSFTAASGGSIATTTNLTNNGTVTFNSDSIFATLNGTNSAAVLNQFGTLTVSGGGSYAGKIQDGGPGALSVTGGALVLSGANTFTGDTNISTGRLTITGSLASTGNVNVSGGTFGGDGDGLSTGVVGKLNLSNGTIDPGAATNTIGRLTAASIVANSGGVLNFDLGSSGTFDRLNVSGTADFGGNPNGPATLRVAVLPGQSAVAGTYTIFTSGSPMNGLPTEQSPVGTRQSFNFINNATSIQIQVGAGNPSTLVWKTDAAAPSPKDATTWDVTTNNNWTATAPPSLGSANQFFQFDNVVFDGTTNNLATVTLVNPNGSVLTPSSVTVDTASYTFTGSGSIGGTGSLNITGGGSLVLQTSNNSYTGATNVQNGLLQLGTGVSNPLASGSSVALGDLSNHSGALDLNGNSATVAGLASLGDGSASGAGNVVGTSSSSAVLTYAGGASPNTFGGRIQDGMPSGGTGQMALTVHAGTLVLSGNNTYTGSTTIDPGATLQMGAGGATGSLSAATPVNNNGLLVFNRTDASATFGNDIFGSGSVQQSGTGTLILSGNLGYSNTSTNITTISSGSLEIGGNHSDTFNGPINGAGNLIVGDGTSTTGVALSAANNYIGSTTVNTNGTLTVNSNAAINATSGVTLNGGTEIFSNTVSGNNFGTGTTIQVSAGGGTLQYGGTNTAGLNNDINVAGSSLVIDINAGSKTTFTDNANFNGSGTIALINSNSSQDSTFQLTNGTGNFSGNIVVGVSPGSNSVRFQPLQANSLGSIATITVNGGSQIFFSNNPTSATNFVITGDGSTADVAPAGPLGAIRFANGGSAVSGTITVTGTEASLTVGTAATNTVTLNGQITGPGFLTLGSGTFTLNNTTPNASNYGPTGSGSIATVIGTIATRAGTVILGNASSISTGGLQMQGGTLQLNGNSISVANLSSNASNGTINNSGPAVSGGTATLTFGDGSSQTFSGVLADGATGGVLAITMNNNSANETFNGANTFTGATNINSGTLEIGATGKLASTAVNVNNGPNVSTLTVDAGGTLAAATNLTNNGTVNLLGTATTVNTLNGTDGTAVVNINSGTLNIASGGTFAGGISGGGTLAVNGGTFTLGGQLSSSPTLTVNGTLNLSSAPASITALNGTNSAAVVNLHGSALQISNGGSYAGAIADAGSGTVSLNGGSLVLGGASTYVGDTNVGSATLVVNGSLATTGNVIVNGGTLAGSGAVGKVTMNSGAIHPGASANDGSIGTLALTTLNDSSAELRFDLSASNSSKDVIAVNGAATFSGSPTISLNLTGTPAIPSSYVVLTSTSSNLHGGGAVVPTLSTTHVGRVNFSIDAAALNSNQIQIDVTGTGPASLTWNNAGGSPADGQTWDIETNKNWKNGAASDAFFENDNVNFTDANNFPANPNAFKVVLNSIVHPGSVAVSANGNYTLSGGGSISGVGGISKSGSGTFILGTNNNYSGATVVNAGVLQVGDSSINSGSSGTLGSGSITTNATLAFAHSDNVTLTTSIDGTGQVAQAGTGTLVFVANNTYGGGTTINAGGTVQVGDPGTNTGTTGNLGTGGITNNGTLIFNRSNTLAVNGVISGSGSLQQNGTGSTLTLGGASFYSGPTTINAGTLSISAGNNLGDGSATNSVTINNNSTLQAIATLDLGATRPVIIGSSGAKFDVTGTSMMTVSGPVSGTATLTKTNSGTLALAGNNTAFSGSLAVNAGTLSFAASNNLGDASSGNTITLGNGATLQSTGTTDIGVNRSITLTTAGTIDVSTGNALTVSGIIGGGAATLNKTSAGKLILTGANSYTGITTITAGTIEAGPATAFVGLNGAVRFINGTIHVTGNPTDIVYALQGGTSTGTNTTNKFTTAGAAGATGTFDIDAGVTLQIGTNNNVAGLQTAVGGSTPSGSNFIKTGAGTLRLQGQNNQLDVALIVQSGTVDAQTPRSLGGIDNVGANFVDMRDGATLILDSDGSNAASPPNPNALPVITSTGADFLTELRAGGAAGGNRTINVVVDHQTPQAASTMAMGALSSTGDFTLNVSPGPNMNSGNAGLYLYPSGPLNQAAYAGAALSGNATLNVVNSAAATMTLTINGGITTAAGAPAGSAFGINKTGNGTLLLTNNANGTNSVGNVASNYTGATKVTQGVLQLGANNMIPATSGLVMNGGTFNAATFSDIIGTLTAAASSTIDLGAGGTNTLKFADSQLTASSWGTGAVLTINNWDAVNSPNQNHILIGGSLQALTRNELNDIVFAGSASPHAVLVMNGADAELVPGTPLAPLKRGDLNGDGFITNADFNQLMIALTNPATYEASYPVGAPLSAGELLDVADINRDGSVNNLDMQAELYAINTGIAPGATLSGGSPANTSAVPEPGSFVLIGLGGLLLSSVARKRRSGKLVRE